MTLFDLVERERRGVARQLTAGGVALVLAGVAIVLLAATLTLGDSRWLSLPRLTPFLGWGLALVAGILAARWVRGRLNHETSITRIAGAVESERRMRDGAVRAMVGGRDYGASQFNRATEAMRQPGSSFKPIVYGTAMREGLVTSRSVVVDRPICLGNWCPQNYDREFKGPITLTQALAESRNIPAVRVSPTAAMRRLASGWPPRVRRCRRAGASRAARRACSRPSAATATSHWTRPGPSQYSS